MSKRRRFFLATTVMAFLSASCAQKPAEPAAPPDTRAADEAAIRAADQDFVKCAEAKDLDKCMSLYADDAVLLETSGATIGKDNIRKPIQGLLSAGLKITVTTTSVLVSRSGDLALDQGTVQVIGTDKKGKPQTSTSQYALTWKKMPDGSWKIAADTSAPLK